MLSLLLVWLVVATSQDIDCIGLQASARQTVLNIAANSSFYKNVVGESRVLFFDLRFTNTGNSTIHMPLQVQLAFNNESKTYTLQRIKEAGCAEECITNRLRPNATFLLRKTAIDYGVPMGNSTTGQLSVSIGGATCSVGIDDPPALDSKRWLVFSFTAVMAVLFAVVGLI